MSAPVSTRHLIAAALTLSGLAMAAAPRAPRAPIREAEKKVSRSSPSVGSYDIEEVRSSTDLGFVEPLVITDDGSLAGIYSSNQDADSIPFFKVKQGPILGIPVPGSAPGSRVFGLNTKGVVVGSFAREIGGKSLGYYASIEKGVALLDFRAKGIDDAGRIIGSKHQTDSTTKGVLFDGKRETTLRPLAGHSSSYATSVSSQGLVVGYCTSADPLSEKTGSIVVVPVKWDETGAPLALPVPSNFKDVRPVAVNNNGTVAMLCWAPNVAIASIYMMDRMGQNLRQVPTNSANQYVVSHLNDLDEMVGYATSNTSDDMHAWFYKDGQSFDLIDLIPRGSAVVPIAAMWINNKSEIVGLGKKKGAYVGFIMRPHTK